MLCITMEFFSKKIPNLGRSKGFPRGKGRSNLVEGKTHETAATLSSKWIRC
uniref:Uncharacterized protein n=1 Tax=Rhizophora mucronata TaxID=61149 RepID=A0A2P2Q6K9_RHIMU